MKSDIKCPRYKIRFIIAKKFREEIFSSAFRGGNFCMGEKQRKGKKAYITGV